MESEKTPLNLHLNLTTNHNSSDSNPKSSFAPREKELEIFHKLIKCIQEGAGFQLDEVLRKYPQTQFVDFQDDRGMTLLHIACENSRHECVQILLQNDADPNKLDRMMGRSPLHWALDVGCHCEDCCNKTAKCIEKLLHYGADVDCDDLNGESPLDLSAKNILSKCALLLIENGAFFKGDSHNGTGKLLIERMPGVLFRILDKGISYDGYDATKLKLDFAFLFRRKKQGPCFSHSKKSASYANEMDIPLNITKIWTREKKAILTHPWLEAFLHLKWLAVRKWFWLIRCIYAWFLLFFTYFIFDIYVWKCPFNGGGRNSSVSNVTVGEFDEICFEKLTDIPMYISAGFALLCLFCMILNEVFEYKVDRRAYLTNYLNVLWWNLILCTGLTMSPAFGFFPQSWQYPAAAFALFYAWGMNFTQISRLPFFGDYIEMLGKVLTDFFLFVFTFSSLIIAFTLSMCVMFPENDFFGNIPLGFVKVLITLIGEADYEGLFKENVRLEELNYSIPAHIMYAGFILILTIIVMNLLLALAVNDIQELRRQASIKRAIRQITQISMLEAFINNVGIGSWLASHVLRQSSVEATIGRYLTFSPIDPTDKQLPEELKQKFIPYLTKSPCLNKHKRNKLKSILAPIRWKNFKNKCGKNTDGFPASPTDEFQTYSHQIDEIKSILKSLEHSVQDIKSNLESVSKTVDQEF